MGTYTPDRWVVLTITRGNESINKVFAGWYGGYLDGDAWKISSGIIEVKEDSTRFTFENESGSVYLCHKKAYGLSGYMASILDNFARTADENNVFVQINKEFENE
jgi:hypothetical protein